MVVATLTSPAAIAGWFMVANIVLAAIFLIIIIFSERGEEKRQINAAAEDEKSKEGWGIDAEFNDMLTMQLALAERAERTKNDVADMEEEISLLKQLIGTVGDRDLTRDERELVNALLLHPDANPDDDDGDEHQRTEKTKT